MEYDLGPLYTTTSEPAPPPPMSVDAGGPGTAPEFSPVTVTATVSGGYTSPLTYSWKVNGTPACGNGNMCTASTGAAGTFTVFEVTVTDGGNPPQNAGDSHSVFAEWPGCPDCPKPQSTTESRGSPIKPFSKGERRSSKTLTLSINDRAKTLYGAPLQHHADESRLA